MTSPPARTARPRPICPRRGLSRAALIGLAGLFLACTAEPPEVDDPGGGEPDLPPYADTVMAFSEGGGIITCTDSLGTCEGGEPIDACDREEVLGAPDDISFVLGAGASLELGFRCGGILELGGSAPGDFQIWADVPDGASAVVEVSYDGSTFETLVQLNESDQILDLAREDVGVARFVRLSDRGNGGIAIDAIEALR